MFKYPKVNYIGNKEKIAKWICDQIPECYKVSVQESEGNTATYTTDDDEQDI